MKIRGEERLEPPHVSIVRRQTVWRWDLRARGFLDQRPDPREVPAEVVEFVLGSRAVLVAAWDEKYPHNPVGARESDHE